MTEHHVPKGVDLDTLREIIAGWGEVGATEAPEYTTAVEDVTSVSDAVGRQTRFLEEIGVLEPHKQKHRLTDPGGTLASALVEGHDERAKAQARALLATWDLTRDVRGVVEGYPMAEADLVPITAQLAGVDLNTSRVETGIRTLLDLYEWTDLLERDAEGRYRCPESASAVNGAEAAAASDGAADEATDNGAVSERVGKTMETTGTATAAAQPAATVPAAAGLDASERGGTAVEDDGDAAERAENGFGGATDDGGVGADGAARALADGDPPREIVTELATAVTEAKRAAEEARDAADAAHAAAREASDGGTDATPATEPHAVSIAIDVDSAELEAIVSGVMNGLQTDGS